MLPMDFNSCHKAKVCYQNSNSGDIPEPGNEISDLPDFCLSVHIKFAYVFCNLLVLNWFYSSIGEGHHNFLRNVTFPVIHRATLGSLSAQPERDQNGHKACVLSTQVGHAASSVHAAAGSKHLLANIFLILIFLF